ncbi:uncharacterized protein LOC131289089 [Anopheles ziemanni]|uniref:uncharacterized protein LOC131289089 n=1 Tax=Anopheles ziemanni TaxID=345580 RepID=UPI00265E3278|nr:uncharacterized protein LOC131289089 [Anopheles ziemanni]
MLTSEKCFIWLLMVCGMMPFRLNATSGRFVESIVYYWACVFLSVLYAIFAPLIYWNGIGSVMHPSTPLVNYMIVMQFVFTYSVVLLSRFEAITQCGKLMHLLNSILHLREKTSLHTDVSLFEKRLARLLWFKVIVFDFAMLIICGAFFNPMQGRTLWNMIVGYGNMMLVSTMNMTVNFLLAVLYRAEHIYCQINVRVVEIMQGTKTPNEIVKLYLQHTDTTVTVQGMLEILSIPLLLLNLWYFFVVVFAVFYTYTSVVQDMRSGGHFNIANPITFLVSEVGQIYYMVTASQKFTESARSIIQSLSCSTNRMVDDTNDQAVELLTIEYLSRDYTVRIKGLYTIDNTMLFSIVASTTSYMIILVQFYLQE